MAASGDSPDLSVVQPADGGEVHRAAEAAPPSGAPKAVVPEPAPAAAEPSRGSRWVVWLLAAALVVAMLWGLSQGRYAAQLSAEVTRLEGELSVVGAELEAHRSHLASVRLGLEDVTGRMLALRALAALDPMAGAGGAEGDAASPEASDDEAVLDFEPGNPALPPASADF